MIDTTFATKVLATGRLAVVGASDDPKSFGRTVLRELRDHGRPVVAVHPTATEVAGEPCYPDLASVPGQLDAVIVMVSAERATAVVRDALARGVGAIWLFRGVGGAGAVSDEAVRLCEEAGVPVVAGACPLMFLEPVGGLHKLHRGIRRLRHAVSAAA